MYYDPEKKLHLHRSPAVLNIEQLQFLETNGHLPNRMVVESHEEVMCELQRLADTWNIEDAANAFVAGLWSAPSLWLSALPAKLIALVMPKHEFSPYGGSPETCTVCGFRNRAEDPARLWYERMTGSVPLDGDPVGYVWALREMDGLGERPVPTEYDLWTFRAVLTVIRQMPPNSRYSKVRDVLHREKLLPVSKKWVYGSLLEVLALMGILDTETYPGMYTQYTTYQKRDERPSVRVEIQAPLAWWDSSIGINETVLMKLFGTMDCTSVSLADRPAERPPRIQTIAGALERKHTPRRSVPRSPDAGSGPVQAGDVYAVRVREGVWITVYCHRIENGHAVVEYLAGVFPEMPMKHQLKNTVSMRSNGRWQTKVSNIDKTTGVRRVARNLPAPLSQLPEPDKVSFSRAGDLGHLASWCFVELR